MRIVGNSDFLIFKEDKLKFLVANSKCTKSFGGNSKHPSNSNGPYEKALQLDINL